MNIFSRTLNVLVYTKIKKKFFPITSSTYSLCPIWPVSMLTSFSHKKYYLFQQGQKSGTETVWRNGSIFISLLSNNKRQRLIWLGNIYPFFIHFFDSFFFLLTGSLVWYVEGKRKTVEIFRWLPTKSWR